MFLEPIIKTFGWGRAETAGAYSVATLTTGILAIVIGKLNDTLGPKIVLSICGLIAGIGYVLTSMINSIWHLYLTYGLVVAFGVAGFFVPPTSTVARWFVKRRTFMTGIVLLGVSVGTMVIPRVVAKLICSFDWRSTYAIMGLGNFLAIISSAQLLKRNPEEFGFEPYGANGGTENDFGVQSSGSSLGQAIYMTEFWVLCAVYFCFFFCINAVLAHIVVHASSLGLSLEKAANILIAFGGGGIIGRILVECLVTKLVTNKPVLCAL